MLHRLVRAFDFGAVCLIGFGVYIFEYFDQIDFPLLGYGCIGVSLVWFLMRYVLLGKFLPFSSFQNSGWSDGLQSGDRRERKEPRL
jgi:hypothetical protein